MLRPYIETKYTQMNADPRHMRHRMHMCLSVERKMADLHSSPTMLEGLWLCN